MKLGRELNNEGRTRRELIGENLYRRYCSGCHGETGEGDGLHSYNLNPLPANHADSTYMDALSDEHLYQVISEGGAAVGKSVEMPRWLGVLKSSDIENLILYLRLLPRSQRESSQGSP